MNLKHKLGSNLHHTDHNDIFVKQWHPGIKAMGSLIDDNEMSVGNQI